MKLIQKIIFPKIMILSILFIPSFTISCAFNSNQNDTKQEKNEEEKEKENKEEVTINDPNMYFPKIYEKDYYSLIEFENHKPIIGEKIKIKVIQDVVNRVSTSDGKLSFYVEEKNKQLVNFHFKWEKNNIVLSKTYTISIQKK